jgi:molybdopterin converting factor small subunit
MKVQCRLFASLREKVGAKEKLLDLPRGARVSDALASLGLPSEGSYILLRNGVHAELHEPLSEGDVLSVFPLIAGG